MSQKRYLGLELSGAKNAKTTLAVLEYYPKEKKVFVLDVHPGISADGTGNSDEVLIDTIREHADEHPELKLGVNVPLTLPPCFTCNRKNCLSAKQCNSPEVKWMNQYSDRNQLLGKKPPVSKRTARMKSFFTPYTQRPVELWLKHGVLSHFTEKMKFEIDETLGGNKAPLTARMQFLKPYFPEFEMHEVLPKLTVTLLMPHLKLTQRTLRLYRQLEDGVFARQTIIEKMCQHLDIFIYDRDLKKITQNLNAFDAFLCAYTVMLFDRNQCATPPRGFPTASGWVLYPKSPLLEGKAIPEEDEDEA